MTSRQKHPFKVDDVVLYSKYDMSDPKPAIVTSIDDSTGHASYHISFINSEGSLEGFKTAYDCDLKPIDFAVVERHVTLPPDYQKMCDIPREPVDSRLSPDDDQPLEHPSYGLGYISRCTSGGTKLFGSEMLHRHFIVVRFVRARLQRSLSNDWPTQSYNNDSEICEIKFSEAQWGRFISAVGVGDGVPCTISSVGYVDMPPVPERDTNEKFHEEIERKAERHGEEVKALIAKVQALLDKQTVSKKDRQDLLHDLGMLHQSITRDIPFVISQYNEYMEKILNDGKTEIETFLNHTAQRLGVERLLGTAGAPKLLPTFTGKAADTEDKE